MRMMQLLSNAVFLSTPSARRATSKLFHSLTRHDDFYPRPPRGGRPAGRTYGQQVLFISIHALREEGDLRKTVDRPEPSGFLSTPSARRATLTRETRRVPWEISIHALREEGDRCCQKYCPGCRYFYPRPPRGGRLLRGELEPIGFLFLSTPSARRATRLFTYRCACCGISIHALREEGDSLSLRDRFAAQNFYPRPPRGGRLGVLCKDADFLDISIHALREEGDPPRRGSACMLPIFLSTPSARRATHHPRLRSGGQKISIHALREEGDQNSIALIESGKRFLSTPSARRATLTLYHADVLRLISIHALREEGDAVSCSLVLMPCYFYPRPPRGGRLTAKPKSRR